jgi:hypothetical protein
LERWFDRIRTGSVQSAGSIGCGSRRSISYNSPAVVSAIERELSEAWDAGFSYSNRCLCGCWRNRIYPVLADCRMNQAWGLIQAATKKISWFFVCPKVRHLQYKVRRKASGICRYLQGLHFTCIYLKISCKCLQFPAKLLLFCGERAFACWGWLWLFSFGSKQCFCDHQPDFYVQK